MAVVNATSRRTQTPLVVVWRFVGAKLVPTLIQRPLLARKGGGLMTKRRGLLTRIVRPGARWTDERSNDSDGTVAIKLEMPSGEL